jgi:hypothetical protein
MKNKIIKDKILSKDNFNNIKNFMLSNSFSWFYKENQTSFKDPSYFYHSFFHNNLPNSNHLTILNPILEILKPVALINIRANLIINRPSSSSAYHTDNWGSKNLNHKTAIFYVNTNNGYTEFEKDKEKVKSIENRIVIFPAQLSHRAVGQTDEDRRIVINFNFYDGS